MIPAIWIAVLFSSLVYLLIYISLSSFYEVCASSVEVCVQRFNGISADIVALWYGRFFPSKIQMKNQIIINQILKTAAQMQFYFLIQGNITVPKIKKNVFNI